MLAVWVLWYFSGLLWDGMSARVWGLFDNAGDQWRGEEGCDFVNVSISERGCGIEEEVAVSQKILDLQESN